MIRPGIPGGDQSVIYSSVAKETGQGPRVNVGRGKIAIDSLGQEHMIAWVAKHQESTTEHGKPGTRYALHIYTVVHVIFTDNRCLERSKGFMKLICGLQLMQRVLI